MRAFIMDKTIRLWPGIALDPKSCIWHRLRSLSRYIFLPKVKQQRVHSSQVSIRQRSTVKMTWIKKASAVTDWIDNLKKKGQEIYFSILNEKREITLLQNTIESEVLLLESVRKEIADFSRHSNRAPSNYNQCNILAKCLVCDKVLVKKQKNCAWRKCEGCVVYASDIGSTHASTRFKSSRSSISSKNPR